MLRFREFRVPPSCFSQKLTIRLRERRWSIFAYLSFDLCQADYRREIKFGAVELRSIKFYEWGTLGKLL